MSLENQLQTSCARHSLDVYPDVKRLLDSIDREGALGGKPAAPKSKRAKMVDAAYEVYVNAMLSGPYTQVKNIAGNTIPLALRVLETASAVPISQLQRALGAEVTKVSYREAVAEAAGMAHGFMDAFRFANRRFKSMTDHGVSNEDILKDIGIPEKLATQAKLERTNRAIDHSNIDNEILRLGTKWMGNAINFPGSSLSAMDVFFKVINYRSEVSKRAMREAVNADLPNGVSVKNKFEGILQDTYHGGRSDLADKGVRSADLATFTNRPEGKINQLMAEKGHTVPTVRWIVPFRRTMVNLINYGVNRTPLGLGTSSTRKALAAGGAEQAEALGRMATGTMVFGSMYGLFADSMTGEAPRDAQAKDLWLKNGNAEYSFDIGGEKIDMELFGPLTPFLKASADYMRMMSKVDYNLDDGAEHTVASMTEGMLFAMADSFYTEHWLSGITSFLSAADRAHRDKDPAPMYDLAAKMAATFVPRLAQSATRAIDPGVKTTNSPFDRILKVLPGLSKNVVDKVDLWGDVMTHDHFLDPSLASNITGKDMVAKEMFRLGMHIPVSERAQRGVKMTPVEYQQYMKAAGKGVFGLPPLRDSIKAAMGSKLYKQFNTDEGRSAYVKSIVNTYRKSALDYMELSTDWGKRVGVQRQIEAQNLGVKS